MLRFNCWHNMVNRLNSYANDVNHRIFFESPFVHD